MGTGIWCLRIDIFNYFSKCNNNKLLFFYSKEQAEIRLKKEEFWYLSEHFQCVDKTNLKTNEKIINYTGSFEEKYKYMFHDFDSKNLFTNEDLYNGILVDYFNIKYKIHQSNIFNSSIFEVRIELE